MVLIEEENLLGYTGLSQVRAFLLFLEL